MIIKRIIRKFKLEYAKTSSKRYIKYLRLGGVRIGKDCHVMDPHNIQIDISRPELLEIGDHVFLHRGTIILTHDWTSWCFVYSHNDFIPSHGKVKIGNNVWFGENVTVCKGVTIGDNVIIGIGSVVTKSIPSNCVAAGVPVRVLGSYEDYMKKRKKKYVEEIREYANCIRECGRKPTEADFYDDYPIFVDGSNYMDYSYPYHNIFKTQASFDMWKKNHKKIYNGFNDFVNQL